MTEARDQAGGTPAPGEVEHGFGYSQGNLDGSTTVACRCGDMWRGRPEAAAREGLNGHLAAVGASWDCEAYGPEGREHGALCFFSEGARVCATAAECSSRMAGERGRVFGVIRELAEAGDPVGEYLAGEFTSPDQLLGGGDESPVPPSRATWASTGTGDRLAFYHNPSPDERASFRPRPVRPSTPSRVGFRVFGDDGRAEVEGWTPPVVSGGVYHDFVPGGDDATFGDRGTWCAVWVGEGDQADQCGQPREAHRSGLTLAEAVKEAAAAGARAVVRLECGPGVVELLRQVAEDAPATPGRPAPIVPLGSVPVVEDASLPAGRWRMVDAAGEVVREGTVER